MSRPENAARHDEGGGGRGSRSGRGGGAQRMVIAEDMTIYHAEALKEKLMQGIERSAVLELDLSEVAEIDTSGIQLLMLAKRESQACGKSLNIIAHSPAVHELIDFFNIAGYFGDPLVIPARNPA